MQHEITEAHNLLDGRNNIIEPGYCRKLLPVYNKKTDFSSRFHTKEWDYYYIGNQHFALALTIADNGYMGLDSVSLLDFDNPSYITKSVMQFMTLGKKNFPATSEKGDVQSAGPNCALTFENDGKIRHLAGFMNKFKGEAPITFDLTLTDFPEESMVICTPFDKPGHFYYNQKINCMKAKGTVNLAGNEYVFTEEESLATLDWGRGIWTYSNTWYWSSLSCYINGYRFGFNLGYGFGNTSAASENILFYDGKAHKLDDVTFHLPENGYMDPWTFTSSDGRFEMEFRPVLDRAAKLDFKVLVSDQHQVFGHMSGTAVLNDGTKIEVKDMMCFAEKVHNKY
jgi:hypothetical protein